MSNNRTRFVTLMIFTVAAVAFGAADGAATTAGLACGMINAAGHSYSVGASHGATCAVAKKYATLLAKKPVPARSANVTLSGGPRGFKCVGNSKLLASTYPGVAATAQVSGFCRKGKSFTAPYFNWFVKAS